MASKIPTVTGEHGEYFIHSYYSHCGEDWESDWDCACDDECPVCAYPITPYDYEEVLVNEEEAL